VVEAPEVPAPEEGAEVQVRGEGVDGGVGVEDVEHVEGEGGAEGVADGAVVVGLEVLWAPEVGVETRVWGVGMWPGGQASKMLWVTKNLWIFGIRSAMSTRISWTVSFLLLSSSRVWHLLRRFNQWLVLSRLDVRNRVIG